MLYMWNHPPRPNITPIPTLGRFPPEIIYIPFHTCHLLNALNIFSLIVVRDNPRTRQFSAVATFRKHVELKSFFIVAPRKKTFKNF